MENFDPGQPNVVSKPARPVFLTVLCILTFIGSGWGIISGISSYLTANTAASVAQAAMEDAKEELENEGKAGSRLAEKMLSGTSEMLQPANIKKSALFSIVASVFTLLGAVLMFGLKKTGFYSYLLGTAIGIVGPFIAFGGANFLTVITTSAVGFIGILFVILYGLNVKHLR